MLSRLARASWVLVATCLAAGCDGSMADSQADAPVDRGRDIDASPRDDGSPETSTPPFRPVLLSTVDKMPEVVLTPDRLAMEVLSLGRAGVRSDVAIQPGSGIFYFEGQRLVASSLIVIGIATAAVPLESTPIETGQGFSIDTGDGTWFDPTATVHYGFVVDYRQSSPTVHLLADTYTGRRVAFSRTLANVVEPLYIFVGGLRRYVGPQASINPGNDIVNFPFFYDPVALLRAAGIAGADAIVLGWGGSRAGVFNAPPTIEVSADQSVALGSPVVVTARASDPEDGDLTGKIEWGDMATPRGARVSGLGGQFALTPSALGLHTLSATITDSGGKVAKASVRVTVTGTLPTVVPVRLSPDARSGQGIVLTANGLGAHFSGQGKMGIRANRGLLHGFQYFEFHREIGVANVGGGLVTADGNLAPYGPVDVPPSCSVNALGGTWRQLMFSTNFTARQSSGSYYGFAVDYRGPFPIVYVIVAGSVADVIPLEDATVPVYPMLYGNPVTAGANPHLTINFGSQPFHYDPVSILGAMGVDITGLQVGWGAP
jgi:hypothetical protein